MPASEDARAKWRKRKRDQRARKLKEQENEDALEDEDDDDPDLDPPQENEDDLSGHNALLINRLSLQGEKLADGGSRISEFPIAVKRVVIRPHPSVFRIVEVERATQNGDLKNQGVGVMLENVSYGQLQALSAVPRNSPSLLTSVEDISNGSYVITPPKIAAGSGVSKELGSGARVLVMPVHSDWFSPNSVHRLERQVVPHFFNGKSEQHTSEKYMEIRNIVVAKYMESPEKHLSVADCQGIIVGVDIGDLTRIMRFLDHWGIINYCAIPLEPEHRKEGTYLCEDSNAELRVPSATLKSIDSLIQFDKPKCRLKATDVYPELACQSVEDPDFDHTIRKKLSELECNHCSRPVAMIYYQSQKEVDVVLCLDCFNEGRFVVGHSSLDFMKVSSGKEYLDVDGDSWTDRETFLLLEGMQLHNENWNKIAEHVKSKSKSQCILHFVRLPLDCCPVENIEVPSEYGSSTLQNHETDYAAEPKSNGFSSHKADSESEFPFSNSENPVMNLVVLIASSMGPRVAAACAHASLASLCKTGDTEESPGEALTNANEKGAPLPAETVRSAAKDGLIASALKAKLFADHEEREIQRLSANIINHQMKRLELKLKQFAEVETLLMRECEQMERTRQRFAAERALVKSSPQQQFGSPGPQPVGQSVGVGPSNLMNASSGNIRPITGGAQQQPFFSGFGNNNQPRMSGMPHQQGGMYGMGPRLPLSALHPSTSASPNASMFGAPNNTQGGISHQMLRPVSGTKSGLG